MPWKDAATAQAYEGSRYKGRRRGSNWSGRVRCRHCEFTASGTSRSNGKPSALLGAAACRHAARTGHTVELIRNEVVIFERACG